MDYYFKNRLSKNSKELQQIMDKPWLADHIKNGHGPVSYTHLMCIRDSPWMVAGSSILIRWKASGSTSASLGSAVPVVRPISVVSFLPCRDMCMR